MLETEMLLSSNTVLVLLLIIYMYDGISLFPVKKSNTVI